MNLATEITHGSRGLVGQSTYISPHDAFLGHHEDEADEDGRAQHADGAHQGVRPLRALAAEARGRQADDHTQQPRHHGDGAEDQAGQEVTTH